MILRNARVGGVLRDVFVDGDRIVADGAGEEVDLDGRWLIPGLWDHHVHFGQWAALAARLDLSAARSAAEAGSIVRARLAERPGEPVIGYGHRDGLWPDAPDGELLAADVPVVLISGDVHSIWANRTALRHYGLPEDGWLLREQDAFDLNVRISAADDARLDAWALAAAGAAAARGVVGVVDLEMDDAPGAWRRRAEAGFRGLRVRAGVYPERLADAVPTGEPIAGLVIGGPFKLFTDGSLNTRTAWCADPYPGSDDTGVEVHAPAELLDLVHDAVRHGLEPAIHAIGDRAVTAALDAFAAAGASGSIEHAQLVTASDLPRFATLGVRASVQPEHAMDDRDVADRYWVGRTARAFPFRALLDAGARITLGSDAPVAPLDPWIAMDAAVTRSRDARPAWHPEQAITRAEALAATTESAIAAGQPADLVVLDADPETTPLRGMPVAATMVAGAWSYAAM